MKQRQMDGLVNKYAAEKGMSLWLDFHLIETRHQKKSRVNRNLPIERQLIFRIQMFALIFDKEFFSTWDF